MARHPVIAAPAFGALIALACLGACDRFPAGDRQATEETETLPPPIVPPAETSDAAEPPSYEVSIATAAAERNLAKKKCAELQDVERTTCEAEADSAFAAESSELESLRGNQE
jgi:hypothetical protein